MHRTRPHEQSFLVHIQSLTDFTRELETQLDGLTRPVDDLASLAATPLRLGDFGEAHGFSATHEAVTTHMGELLGQARMALSFASEVTQIVADRYREADREVGDALGVER